MHIDPVKRFSLIIITATVILCSNSAFARNINGLDDLISIYAQGLSNPQKAIFKKTIEEAESNVVDDILKSKLAVMAGERQFILRESKQSAPTKLFEFGNKYASVGFEKILFYQGGWERTAYMLLFEMTSPTTLRYTNNYLFWKGRSAVETYKDISKTYLCRQFSTLTQVADCDKPAPMEAAAEPEKKPERSAETEKQVAVVDAVVAPKAAAVESKKTSSTKTAKAEPVTSSKIAELDNELSRIDEAVEAKADKRHAHSGNDIKSGTISEAVIDPAITRDAELQSALAKITADEAYIKSLERRINDMDNTIKSMAVLLKGVTRQEDTIVFTGVNVQIVNGNGSTESRINGRGNLIVGYNEPRDEGNKAASTGSHNIIVGSKHSFSSFGGIVAGSSNTISGKYSSVIGGMWNTASGDFSTVTGGHFKMAKETYEDNQGAGGEKVPEKEAKGGGCSWWPW